MKRVFKWIGILLGVVLALAVVVFSYGYIRTRRHVARVWHVTPAAVPILTDAASVAEGKRLYTISCGDCHGVNGAGKVAIDDPALGRFEGSNLTRGKGGAGATFSDVDWVRAIRHGIKPDGHPLLLMPSDDLYHLTDREVGEIVGYLKSLPPVDRQVPPPHLGPAMYMAYGVANAFPLICAERIDHAAARPPDQAPGLNAGFGKHLVDLNCRSCHGQHLSGGPIPGSPPSLPVPLNITPDTNTGLGRWTEAQFSAAIRTGKTPAGKVLNTFMPWKAFSHMTDQDLAAVWMYLRTVPARPFGQR